MFTCRILFSNTQHSVVLLCFMKQKQTLYKKIRTEVGYIKRSLPGGRYSFKQQAFLYPMCQESCQVLEHGF